ncbi:hypothetical protein FACS189493_1750 [Spirochaetia bacterium]|nr:hypothetical protein FACS189493_1750 [Spirochaetia bacterium]
MTNAALRQELHAAIDTMPGRNLAALKPLFSVLTEPLYTIETDLTDEEKAMIQAGRKEYAEHPETYVPLESVL